MSVSAMKTLAVVCFACTVIPPRSEAQPRPAAARFVHCTFVGADLEKGIIEVEVRAEAGRRKETFSLAEKNIPITSDTMQPLNLTKVPTGTRVLLRISFAGDVVGLHAVGPVTTALVKSVDSSKRTITLYPGEGLADRTKHVLLDSKIIINGRFLKLHDVRIGHLAQVKLTLDKKSIAAIRIPPRASGPEVGDAVPDVAGVLKAVDPARGALTVEFVENGKETIKTYRSVDNATVSLVDGKGNNLGDLMPGMKVALWISVDHTKFLKVKAEVPLKGEIQSVDPANGTITLVDENNKAGKTLPVDPDAKIMINTWTSELQDFRPGWHVSIVPSRNGDRALALWTLNRLSK